MKLKTYPEYKDSGVGWLGMVPEHWDVNYYRRHIYIEQGRAFSSKDYVEDSTVACFRMGNIKKGGFVDLEHNIKFLPDYFINIHHDMLVNNNDMLISMTDMSQSLDFLAIPAIFYQNNTDFKFLLNQRVGRVKCFNIHQNFLRYSLLSDELRLQLKQKGFGTIQSNMSNEDLYSSKLALPNNKEQEKIATFLDIETAKLDYLIAKQEKLIELLQEKRQATISHAVTKGLDPNVKMKDSGVEWLGTVPEHWEILQFRHMVSIQNGSDYKDIESDDGPYPVIGSGGQFKNATNYIYDGASVLLGRKGTIDKPLYVEGKFWVVDTMFYTIIKEIVLPKYVFNCAKIIPFDLLSTSTALPSMTQNDLKTLCFAIPKSLSEQKSIIDFIENQTAKIDLLIEKAKQSIELAKEHRTALISAAVTGKIDVREYAL